MFYNILMYILSFTMLIFSVVFIHELGHFLLARINGVRVNTFSIGFGKEIFGWNDKHGTRWKVAWIPLGGYVKMFGQSDLPEDSKKAPKLTAAEKKVHFQHKNRFQRFTIVFAGPLFNFIFAFTIFFFLAWINGEYITDSRYVANVMPNTPAANVLEKGDKIFKLSYETTTSLTEVKALSTKAIADKTNATNDDNKELQDSVSNPTSKVVKDFTEIQEFIHNSNGRPVRLFIKRNNGFSIRVITPVKADGSKFYTIGYQPDIKNIGHKDFTFIQSFGEAGRNMKMTVGLMLDGLGKIFTGKESAKNIGGIITISTFAKKALDNGFAAFLAIIAFISINLGIVNLLPLPVLDGGYVLQYAIESIIRRDIPEKLMNVLFFISFILLIGLLLFSVLNDILRLAHVY